MNNLSAEQNESLEQAPPPSLCANNCGFFANPACTGFCSKCYRDQQNELSKTKAAEAAFENARSGSFHTRMPHDASNGSESASVKAPEPQASVSAPTAAVLACSPSEPSPQKNPGRCFSCKKKVGLTGFKCKCGMVFCGQHRYAEAHSCTFDYKSMERQKLAENNPVVQASKVQKF